MKNLRPSLAFLAASVFHLVLLPASTAFSASLRVEVNNETKIDTSFGSSNPNNAPIEVESWTEALTSPKVKEAGNSFIVLHGRDDGAEAAAANEVTWEAIDPVTYEGIYNVGLTKTGLQDSCCIVADVVVGLHDALRSPLIPDDNVQQLFIGILKDTADHGVVYVVGKLLRYTWYMYGLEEDDPAVEGVMRIVMELHVLDTLLRDVIHEKIVELEKMNEEEFRAQLLKFIDSTEAFLHKIWRLNPEKKYFANRVAHRILKQVLSAEEYRVAKKKVPLLLKQLKGQDANTNNPLAPASDVSKE
jgi:hypothetical protein